MSVVPVKIPLLVPKIAHSSSLLEVKNQLTPGDAYRQRLLVQGKEGRELVRLALRWTEKEEQLRSLVKFQALFRGEI